MRTLPTCLLTSLVLAGSTTLALAREPAVHVLTVQLPDGGIEQIRYTGDVVPAVILDPAIESADQVPPFRHSTVWPPRWIGRWPG